MNFKKGKLMYNPKFSTEVVKAAGNFFVQEQFFTDDRKTTIILEQNKDTVMMMIVVDKYALKDTSYDYHFRNLSNKACTEVFSGSPTLVELVDITLSTFRRIK